MKTKRQEKIMKNSFYYTFTEIQTKKNERE